MKERDDPSLDAYDAVGQVASQTTKCMFCDIVSKIDDKKLWFEDEHV